MPKKRKPASRTVWQAMNNEESGVPLAHNAANLAAFLSPRGADLDKRIWTADRGDFWLEPGLDQSNLKIEPDGAFLFESTGVSNARGIYPKISSTDSALMVVSARPNDAGFAEGPTIISRFGGSGGPGEGTWRVRTHPAGVGDQIYDDSGNLFGDTVRTTTDTSGHHILVGALDRATNTYNQLTWLNTNTKQHVFSASTSALTGAISPKTKDEGSKATSSHTFVGRFYGIGLWVFPSGLPSDWEMAALTMGLAWKNGKYTFWPRWGVI